MKHSEIVMMLKPILDTSGDNLAEYMTGTKNMVGMDDKNLDKYAKNAARAIEQGATVVKQKSKRLWDPMTDDLEPDMSDYDVILPSKFHFTGGMVFISNMPAAEIEQAIMSRSIFVDVYLAESDVLKRIKTIGYTLAENHIDYTKDDIDDVLEALGDSPDMPEAEPVQYITPEYARQSKKLTVRAMQLALIMKKSGLARWKELAALYA